MLRESVVPYRPGQYVAHDIVSRVEFTIPDKEKLNAAQRKARGAVPHIYTQNNEGWQELQEKLLAPGDLLLCGSSNETAMFDVTGRHERNSASIVV